MESGEYELSSEQTDESNALHSPIPELDSELEPQRVTGLEAWDYLLAAFVIEDWRSPSISESEIEFTTTYIFNELGLKGVENRNSFLNGLDKSTIDPQSTSLTRSVQIQFDSLRKELKQQKIAAADFCDWLDEKVVKLDSWFYLLLPPNNTERLQSTQVASGCLGQLQLNTQALRAKSLQQLSAYFAQLRQTDLPILNQRLRELDEALENIYNRYHQQYQNGRRKESAAARVFYNLKTTRLFPSGWFRKRPDLEAVVRTLQKTYEFRLEAEMHLVAAQLIGELMQQTRLYEKAITQVDAFLGGLQNWLKENSTVEPLFVPLLQEAARSRINPLELRHQLEASVGASFEQWGSLEDSKSTELCQQLLLEARTLRQQVHGQCCRYLLNSELSESQTILTQEALPPVEQFYSDELGEAEGKFFLQFQENTDIRELLWAVETITGKKLIADASVSGTISSFPTKLYTFSEAIETIRKAGNLTYIQKEDVYIFSSPDIEDQIFDYQVGIWHQDISDLGQERNGSTPTHN